MMIKNLIYTLLYDKFTLLRTKVSQSIYLGFILSTLLSFPFFSCQNQVKENTITQTQNDLQIPAEEKKGIRSSAGRDHTHKRGSALSILDHRISNDKEKFYSIIESGIWEYFRVVTGSDPSKDDEYKGHWVDYKEDLTYEKGIYDKVMEKGKYHYTFTDGILLMIPEDKTKNPEEWDVKFGSDVMIMIGRPEYGHNHIQQKLERRQSIKELQK